MLPYAANADAMAVHVQTQLAVHLRVQLPVSYRGSLQVFLRARLCTISESGSLNLSVSGSLILSVRGGVHCAVRLKVPALALACSAWLHCFKLRFGTRRIHRALVHHHLVLIRRPWGDVIKGAKLFWGPRRKAVARLRCFSSHDVSHDVMPGLGTGIHAVTRHRVVRRGTHPLGTDSRHAVIVCHVVALDG